MSTTTRRQFLSGTVATALAAPWIVPASVFGKDGNVAPSERISMGIIGCGIHGFGWNMDMMFRNPEQQIVAVCDVDKNHKERAQKKVEAFYSDKLGADYKGCRAYDDFRDLVNRKDVDAVHIVTPDHWHALMSVFALKAGKHVICEKPTLTIREGRLVEDARKKTGRVFLTASENRTIDDYQHIVNVVRNGLIGKLRHIKVLLPGGNSDRTQEAKEAQPVPPELDYEKWLGPAPKIPYIPARLHNTWRWHLNFSGGSLTDWGSHNINLAQWANDSDDTGPVKIRATKWDYPPDDAVWTTTAIFDVDFEYANGVTMKVWNEVPGIKFEGDKGWIMIRGYRGQMTASDEALLTWQPGPNDLDVAENLKYCTVGKSARATLGNILGGEQVHFTHCIKTGQEPYYTAEGGHRNHTIAHLAQISMKGNGMELQWDPAAERFVGENARQATASMFYERPQRAPWTFDHVDSWINVG